MKTEVLFLIYVCQYFFFQCDSDFLWCFVGKYRLNLILLTRFYICRLFPPQHIYTEWKFSGFIKQRESDGLVDGQSLSSGPYCIFVFALFENNESKELETSAKQATTTFALEKYS